MLPTAAAPAPEMERLHWPEHPAWYQPDYARCLTGVFPTVFELLGRPVPDAPTLMPHLPGGSPRQARRVLVLCLDGLGFAALAQSQRLQRLYGQCGTWITSVFPSITSCALSSLFQGMPPARHGILGHNIWKDAPGAVVDMLRMQVPGASASLKEAGFDPAAWKREPGLLETGRARAVPSYQLLHNSIRGSGLSTMIYGDTPLVGFAEQAEGFTKTARMLEDMESGWVGLYLATVDTLSHVLTGEAEEVGLAVRYLEDNLAWMAGRLPREVREETVFLVMADHGQDTIRERIDLTGEPGEWLAAHTRAVGSSGRTLHVYLDPRHEAPVAERLGELVQGRGRVLGFEQVRGLTGLNGADPEHERWVRQSLGDLVVVLEPGVNFQRRTPPDPADEPYASRLVSQHGALGWDEMFVPFLCAPLSAILEG